MQIVADAAREKLEKFVAEVRAGFRQGSVASSHEPGALDRTESWIELQRELEDIRVSASMVDEHQTFIKAWFKDVIVLGVSPTVPASTTATTTLSNFAPSLSRGSLGCAVWCLQLLAALNDSRRQRAVVGTGRRRRQRRRPAPPSHTPTTTAQDLDSLVSRDEPAFPQLAGPTRSDTTASSHGPTALLRKPSMGSVLYQRLFQKDMRLVEATSDGSLERVATLISRGAKVNVRDRWGWSALSMAAYGGHERIAKLLLACGADIDVVDVDGDSPLDLATNGGHAPVVIAIEEERVNRVARGMPDPRVPGVKVRTGLKQTKSGGADGKASSRGVSLKGVSPGLNPTPSSSSPLASAVRFHMASLVENISRT